MVSGEFWLINQSIFYSNKIFYRPKLIHVGNEITGLLNLTNRSRLNPGDGFVTLGEARAFIQGTFDTNGDRVINELDRFDTNRNGVIDAGDDPEKINLLRQMAYADLRSVTDVSLRERLQQAQLALRTVLREISPASPPNPINAGNPLFNEALIRNPHSLTSSNENQAWSNMRTGFQGRTLEINRDNVRNMVTNIINSVRRENSSASINEQAERVVFELWRNEDYVDGQRRQVFRAEEIKGVLEYIKSLPPRQGDLFKQAFFRNMAEYITNRANNLDPQFVMDSMLQVIQSADFRGDNESRELGNFIKETVLGIADTSNFFRNKRPGTNGETLIGNYDGTRENGIFGSLALVRRRDGTYVFIEHESSSITNKTRYIFTPRLALPPPGGGAAPGRTLPPPVPPPISPEETRNITESSRDLRQAEERANTHITNTRNTIQAQSNSLQERRGRVDTASRDLIDRAQRDLERALEEARKLEQQGRRTEAARTIGTANTRFTEERTYVELIDEAQENAINNGLRTIDGRIRDITTRLTGINERIAGCERTIRTYDESRPPWYLSTGLWGGLITAVPSAFVNRNASRYQQIERDQIRELTDLRTQQAALQNQLTQLSTAARRAREERNKRQALEHVNRGLTLIGADTYQIDNDAIRRRAVTASRVVSEDMERVIRAIEQEERAIRFAQQKFAEYAAKVVSRRTGIPEEACRLAILSLSNISETAGHIILGNSTSDRAIDDAFDRFLDDCAGIVIDKISRRIAREATTRTFRSLPQGYRGSRDFRRLTRETIRLVLRNGLSNTLEQLRREDPDYARILEEALRDTIRERIPLYNLRP